MSELIDPAVEARKIYGRYLTQLHLSRNNLNWVVGRLIPSHDKIEDRDHAEAKLDELDEWFGREVDKWRNDDSPAAKEVLKQLVSNLATRNDLTLISKRIIHRLKEELGGY
jgi:hypothetical protein